LIIVGAQRHDRPAHLADRLPSGRGDLPHELARPLGVALAEVHGAAAGLAAVDELRSAGLDGYYLFHAARADLLRRLGRDEEAAAAYAAARALTANPVEQGFLDAQLAAVLGPGLD